MLPVVNPQKLQNPLKRWLPGQTVKIAFLDGDRDLHSDIEEATKEITDACNLVAFEAGYRGRATEFIVSSI
jgi:hypothetical protein